MIADILKNIKQLGNQEEVKTAINDLMNPCVKYVGDKVSTLVFFFQIIAVLIVLQVLATLFLIVNEIRRSLSK
jgi:hypothetical protein